MANVCDTLGTIWIPSDSFLVAPGATVPIQINPGQPVLVIAYGASAFQPGTWWDASVVSLVDQHKAALAALGSLPVAGR